MELNGANEYFQNMVKRSDGLYLLKIKGLDGASFMAAHKKELEELTWDGRIFNRVWEGFENRFYIYREMPPQTAQSQS